MEAADRVLGPDLGATEVEIHWDVEWHALKSQIDTGDPPIYKLSIWDTADGMTGDVA